MPSPDSKYDAIIIGGGPTGSTAALVLARAGYRALVLERSRFPRFRIGESLLPRNFKLFEDLGLVDAIRSLPHVPKYGVEFAMGHGRDAVQYPFTLSLLPGSPTFNIERAPFDNLLLTKAREAGAEVREEVQVKAVPELTDGAVTVKTADGGEVRGRWLIDASGQHTVLGRQLKTRCMFADRHLQRVAYFAQFEDVWRHDGEAAGYPCIIMANEGWFWMIPLDERRTSIGMVIHPDVQRQQGAAANRMLRWGIERCPVLRQRLAGATGPETNMVTADFSYTCAPYAGPGYFLAGDAATFLDPIFSAGVCVGMMSGKEAADVIIAIQQGRTAAARARDRYSRFIESGTDIFYNMIRSYYKHPFRELFLSGGGPLQVHRAVLAVLAGQVFPRPVWALRWRVKLFEFFLAVQKYVPLVPRREPFSLLAEAPVPPERFTTTASQPVRNLEEAVGAAV